MDNSYPDLAACAKSLKCLEYDRWPYREIWGGGYPLEDETFDLNQLVGMIVQVSECIETLRLGIRMKELDCRENSYRLQVSK